MEPTASTTLPYSCAHGAPSVGHPVSSRSVLTLENPRRPNTCQPSSLCHGWSIGNDQLQSFQLQHWTSWRGHDQWTAHIVIWFNTQRHHSIVSCRPPPASTSLPTSRPIRSIYGTGCLFLVNDGPICKDTSTQRETYRQVEPRHQGPCVSTSRPEQRRLHFRPPL